VLIDGLYHSAGFPNVVEMNWWEGGTMTKEAQGQQRQLRLVCTPAQHWYDPPFKNG
jgi:hypothetical protein